MANKTVVIEVTNYIIGPLTFGQGKELFTSDGTLRDINTPLLRHSLNNADGGTRTDADVDALPYPHAMELIGECLELNGLRKAKAGEQGEAEPAKAPE